MRSRRWLAAIAALTVLVTSAGVAVAREGEEREPWEVEAEGADKVVEVVPLNAAGRAAGAELDQAVNSGSASDGGAAQTPSGPSAQTGFFPDHELPCST